MELVFTAFLGLYNIFNENTLLGSFAVKYLCFITRNFCVVLGTYYPSGQTHLRIIFSFLACFGTWVWKFLLFLAEAIQFYAFCKTAQ